MIDFKMSFQGEVGEPGQKGSKADKGEQVRKYGWVGIKKMLVPNNNNNSNIV